MDLFDRQLKAMAQEEPFPLPEDYAGKVFSTCASLEEKTMKTKNHTTLRRWLIGVAAALAILVAVPNLSPSAAAAMEKIPVLGSVVRVITFRHYTQDSDHTHADVSIPQIEGSGASSVNADIQKYVDQLLKKFQSDCADIGEAYESLDVSYKVVTDTDDWFTLRVDALEIQASGYEFSKIYNIDKSTGRTVALGDLFRSGADWKTVLKNEVLRQMKEQMADTSSGKTYFTDEFTGIPDNQNYYFDQDGNLVLAFDEYSVAPGSMGAVEFTVKRTVYQDLLK